MSLEELIGKTFGKTKYGLYPLFGTLPKDMQIKLSEKLDSKKTSFAYSQISFSIGFSLLRYFFSDSLENYPSTSYLGLIGKVWSYQSFLVDGLRTGYIIYSKKPIGLLKFEIPYRLFKITSKKAKKIYEKYKD